MKFGKIAMIILLALTYIVTPLLSGISTLITEGDPKPLIQGTLGLMIAPDKLLIDNVGELIDKEEQALHPDKYNPTYINALRQQIFLAIAIMGILWALLYMLWTAIFSEATLSLPIKAIILFILCPATIYLIALLYTAIVFKQFYGYPFQGLTSLILNAKEVLGSAISPTGMALQPLFNANLTAPI